MAWLHVLGLEVFIIHGCALFDTEVSLQPILIQTFFGIHFDITREQPISYIVYVGISAELPILGIPDEIPIYRYFIK